MLILYSPLSFLPLESALSSYLSTLFFSTTRGSTPLDPAKLESRYFSLSGSPLLESAILECGWHSSPPPRGLRWETGFWNLLAWKLTALTHCQLSILESWNLGVAHMLNEHMNWKITWANHDGNRDR